MPNTYTVKPGETLWGIAQKYLGTGSRWKELGYAGDPTKLAVGTVLTIPGAVKTPASQIKPTTVTPAAKAVTTTPAASPVLTSEGKYNISQIQSELTAASTAKKQAATELEGLSIRLYEQEYGKSGLGETKGKIAQIDTDITARKARRDQMVLDEEGKPIPQWMITGRKALEVQSATDDLNRMIDERNTLANQYNTGLGEVSRKAEAGLKDASTKYAFWESEESRLTGLAQTYQTLLSQELGRATEAERWAKEYGLKEKGSELEQKLYELKVAEAGKPTTYEPPSSYQEWVLAGSPGTFEQWLAKKTITPPTSFQEWELAGKPGTFAEWLTKTTTSIPAGVIGFIRQAKAKNAPLEEIEDYVRNKGYDFNHSDIQKELTNYNPSPKFNLGDWLKAKGAGIWSEIKSW